MEDAFHGAFAGFGCEFDGAGARHSLCSVVRAVAFFGFHGGGWCDGSRCGMWHCSEEHRDCDCRVFRCAGVADPLQCVRLD